VSEGENVYKNYLNLLQKANLEERSNPAKSLTLLGECLELIQGNRIIFIDLHPKRRRDELIIKDRISRMQSKIAQSDKENKSPIVEIEEPPIVKEKFQSSIIEEILTKSSKFAQKFEFQLAELELHKAHQIAVSIENSEIIAKIAYSEEQVNSEKINYKRKLIELEVLVEEVRNYLQDKNLSKTVKSCQMVIKLAETLGKSAVLETHKKILVEAENGIIELKKMLPGIIIKFNLAEENDELHTAIELSDNIADIYRRMDDWNLQYQYLERKEKLQKRFWKTPS
jgi:hypothetical protein